MAVVSRPPADVRADPLLPWLRSVAKALDNLNSSPNSVSELDKLVSTCISTFKNDVRYQNDVRFLKIWFLYMDGSSEFQSIFREMQEYNICLQNSLLYESYALFLEAKGMFKDALTVYRLGISRKEVEEYLSSILNVRDLLCELFSEVLGLNKDKLRQEEFMESGAIVFHNYPLRPQSDPNPGLIPHTDMSFLTMLLQDNIGGLQVLHQDQWLDVTPLRGALIVNIGYFMQIVSNDRFKSDQHKFITPKSVGPRKSTVTYFFASTKTVNNPIKPLKEVLLSKNEEAVYKEVHFREYAATWSSSPSSI